MSTSIHLYRTGNTRIAKWLFVCYWWPWRGLARRPILQVRVMQISIINISQMGTAQTLLLPAHRKSNVDFPLAYLHLTLAPSNCQSRVHDIFIANISQMVTDVQTLLLATNIKLHVIFRLAYLHLNLHDHSNDQSQSCTFFHCKYLANRDRWSKHLYCQQIELHVAFWIADLNFTLAYSKVLLGRWNSG